MSLLDTFATASDVVSKTWKRDAGALGAYHRTENAAMTQEIGAKLGKVVEISLPEPG
jgi:hypothetical protein